MNLTDVVGTVVDGKYQVERMLGRGGMGAVFFATHLGTERPVALKIIVPQYAADASFLERFRREARAAGRFRHPNIVDVTDFGQADICGQRVAYLVMEYLDGCSLEDVLIEQPVVPADWTVEIFDQLTLGLGELHRKGIIHRDLKPGNIWLEPNLRGGFTVKLLDFGLAKLQDQEPLASEKPHPETSGRPQPDDVTVVRGADAANSREGSPARPVPASEAATVVGARGRDTAEQEALASEATTRTGGPADATRHAGSPAPPANATEEPPASPVTEPMGELTVAGSVLGTPAYMSPEQCRGEAATSASDVYSLGVIAYQMLGGSLPFEGNMSRLMYQHLQSEPQAVHERNPDVPRAVSNVVMSALEKDPAARPSSVELFAAALKSKSETPWGLISRAIVMLFEHFPVFLRTTSILLTPFFVLVAAELIVFVTLLEANAFSSSARISAGLLGPLNWIVLLLGTIFSRGVTTLLIGQILLAPLKKLRVELVFSLLKRMISPALAAAALIGLVAVFPATIGFGMLKSVVAPSLLAPNSIFFRFAEFLGHPSTVAIAATLIVLAYVSACELLQLANVILVERLPLRQAIRRSTELRRRSVADSFVVAIFVVFPLFTPTVIDLMHREIVTGLVGGTFAAVLISLLRLFSITLNAVLIATLYFKQRQTAGESIEAVLACQYVNEPPPKTMWQQRLNYSLESMRSGSRDSQASGFRSGARSGSGVTPKNGGSTR